MCVRVCACVCVYLRMYACVCVCVHACVCVYMWAYTAKWSQHQPSNWKVMGLILSMATLVLLLLLVIQSAQLYKWDLGKQLTYCGYIIIVYSTWEEMSMSH